MTQQTELEKAINKIINGLRLKVAQSSIRKAGTHFGISPATVVRLNRGDTPDVETLKKIEKVLYGE